MSANSDFEQAYRQYYEQLYWFAYQYIADEDECHDVVNGAYEDLWRNVLNVDFDTVRQYLYTSVRNKSIDLLRRKAKHLRFIEYAELTSQRFVDEKRYEQQEYNSYIINKVMSNLSPKTRHVLTKCYIEGKKYKEVAEELGVSTEAVKKHMISALKTIKTLKNVKK